MSDKDKKEPERAKAGASANASAPESSAQPLTAAAAAKRVQRTITEYVNGKDEAGQPARMARQKQVPVEASEVLSYRDYGTHVVVVTIDGQKLVGELA